MQDADPDSPCDSAGGALAICVLASGSGGNAAIVRTPSGAMLIDAGIGPRTTGRRIAEVSRDRLTTIDSIRAVCLTHLDSDHCNDNWFATFAKREIRVWCHASRTDPLSDRATEQGHGVDVRAFEAFESFEPLPGVRVTPIPFAHDATGSHGFIVDGYGSRIGYATDLGRVTDGLLEHFCDLDVLAIESNYDRQMQLESPRPAFLKNRIMGGRGHLSNDEAFRAVKLMFDRCEKAARRLPRHVVLLHRSRDCNCPDLLRDLFRRDKRIAPRLTLAHQHEPTPWLRAGPLVGEQMLLAW